MKEESGGVLISPEMKLIEALLHGDKVAWEQFEEEYAPAIRAAISDVMGASYQGFDIDDVYQEVLVELIDDDCVALARFEGRAAFSTWLWSLARNVTRSLIYDNDSPGDIRDEILGEQSLTDPACPYGSYNDNGDFEDYSGMFRDSPCEWWREEAE